MAQSYRYCPNCATPLEWLPALEDSGHKERLRCPGCGWTHWNNPTPVLAAVIECSENAVSAAAGHYKPRGLAVARMLWIDQ